MKYTLRPYQQEAADIAVEKLRKQSKPFIIQAATGAGKSLIIAEICHQIDEPILILQPSKEILVQNYAKLLSYDPMIDAGIYSASAGRKEVRKFTFATIGSIYKKPEEFKHFKFAIIDECHGLNSKNTDGMLTKFFKAIECNSVCGLTATPYRIDQIWKREPGGVLSTTASLKMLNRIFSRNTKPFFKGIAYKIETPELIEQGYLSKIKYFTEQSD
jgi:DNA repair protein RadD